MKIYPVAGELFIVNGRTDMTKLIIAFRSLMNAHKNNQLYSPAHAVLTSNHTNKSRTLAV